MEIEVVHLPSEKSMVYSIEKITGLARWACIRVKANCFLGLCGLTWATAVLLGGLLSDLSRREFWGITFLLVATAIEFGAVVSCHSFLPDARVLSKKSHWASSLMSISRYWLFGILECIYIVVFTGVLSWNAFLPVFSHLTSVKTWAFKVFYYLVCGNVSLIIFGFGLKLELSHFPPCLVKYHDRLLKVGLLEGLEKQSQVEVVDAIFEMMGGDFRVQSKKEEVCIAYESMIKFVYNHERGFEATLKAMQSTDRYVQEAAAHIVGFWMDSNGCIQKQLLYFERSLIKQLVELSTNSVGPTAVAAARSLQKLLKHDPQGLMVMEPRRILVQMLIKRVAELVDLLSLQDSFKMDYESLPLCHYSLLYICKAMTLLLSANQDLFRQCLMAEEIDELSQKLLIIFNSSHCSWKRMQVIVGHALQQLHDHISPPEDSLHLQLKVVTAAPKSRIHIFEDEKKWFDSLVDRNKAQSLEWRPEELLHVISIQQSLIQTRQNLLAFNHMKFPKRAFTFVASVVYLVYLLILLTK